MRRVGRIPAYRPTQGHPRHRLRHHGQGCSPYKTRAEVNSGSYRRRMFASLVICGLEWLASSSLHGRTYHSFVTESRDRRVLFLLSNLIRHGHGVPDWEFLALTGGGEHTAESGDNGRAGAFRGGRCTCPFSLSCLSLNAPGLAHPSPVSGPIECGRRQRKTLELRFHEVCQTLQVLRGGSCHLTLRVASSR